MTQEVDELINGDYFCKEDIWTEMVPLTIVGAVADDIPIQGTSRKDRRAVLKFAGERRGMVLAAACNRKWMKRHYGKTTSAWRGVEVCLYVDRSAKYGRDVVGGTRLCRLDVGEQGNWYSGKEAPDAAQLKALRDRLSQRDPSRGQPNKSKQPNYAIVSPSIEWRGREALAKKPFSELNHQELVDYMMSLRPVAESTDGDKGLAMKKSLGLLEMAIEARAAELNKEAEDAAQ